MRLSAETSVKSGRAPWRDRPVAAWRRLVRRTRALPLQISERRILLFVVDLLLMNAGL
ncbi:MAG: hypothetical protein HY660_15945, partial [Armatimonadetes bacterium]|nr:hypothetical protein [Armatimonadota bacterium]